METQQISTFLRNLADNIDQKKLSQDQLALTSEFFIQYLYLFHNKKNYSEKELLSFLSLGWYIHTFLK